MAVTIADLSPFKGPDGKISSPADDFSSEAFSEAEYVDIRRFCGYAAQGNRAANLASYRYFGVYPILNFRMTNLVPAERQRVRMYMAQCYYFESGYVSSADNMDTDKAAVWTHNKKEAQDRYRQFTVWRKRLCSLFQIPAGPGVSGTGAGDKIVI